MKTTQLFNYMKKRSEVENSKWCLSKKYLENHFRIGIRNFFGVELDNNGNLLWDIQQPYNGFFETTNNKSDISDY